MSSVVRALGFLTCELNSRPTSECDCAFFIKKLKMIFSPGRLPCSPPAWPPRTTARAPSTPSRTVFLWWFAIFQDLCTALFQDLPPCTTLSRWRTWTAAWRRSRTATARAAMERQATTSATQDPVWLDGFNSWVCFNSNGYFDLLPHLLIRNALNHPMHDGYYRSYVQQRGDHEFRRGQSHNG